MYRRSLNLVVAVALISLAASVTRANDRTGWTAELETYAHDVSGTCTIVDQDTFRVDHFHYDGQGLDVYFYLGADQTDNAFLNGLQVGPQLVGAGYDDATLNIDLPPGHTLPPYDAVSVWCVDAAVDFGSGTFTPEPTTLAVLASGALVLLRRRRR
jgi:hypothetical protein